jgi:indole-3-glycerol phosphate synthase
MNALRRLEANARRLVAEGYYRATERVARAPSFLQGLGKPDRSSEVIAEIKFASPTRQSGKSPASFDRILERIVAAGPLGLSILTEPRIFDGHLDFLRRAAGHGLPVLMKDIIVDPVQIEAGAARGASAVLVIQSLFHHRSLEGPPQALIDAAHALDLDAVLEVHTVAEWDAAVATDADFLGINNRDLATLEVDLTTTPSILSARRKDRPVIAMSGIETRADVESMLRAGADAVLVGSSLMGHADPATKLEELQHG